MTHKHSLLTWPPCIYSMLDVGGWNSLPGAEVRGKLYTVPSGLSATLHLHCTRSLSKRLQFFYHIIISLSSDLTLISLSLQLRLRLPPPVYSPPFAATFPVLISMIFRSGFSYHRLDRHIPGFRSAARHNSMIGPRTM